MIDLFLKYAEGHAVGPELCAAMGYLLATAGQGDTDLVEKAEDPERMLKHVVMFINDTFKLFLLLFIKI